MIYAFNIELINVPFSTFANSFLFVWRCMISCISLPLFSKPFCARTFYISQRLPCRWQINESHIESHILVVETHCTVSRLLSAVGYYGMLRIDRLYYSAAATAAAIANNFAISDCLIWVRWRYAFNGNVDSGESSSAAHHRCCRRHRHHYRHRQ